MKTLQRYMAALFVLGCFAFLGAQTADASHFRGGYVTYTPTGNPGEVEFTVVSYWRNWNNFTVGQTTTSDNLFYFGDGTTDNSPWEVVSVNATDNWVIFRKVITHTYQGPGPFTAYYATCCRVNSSSEGIFPDGMGNRADNSFRVQALVNLSNPNAGTSSAPFIGVPRSTNTQYQLPVIPNGDDYRCRIATSSETDSFGSAPPNMSIDANTCLITWDNQALAAGFWTEQFVIEEIDAQNNVLTTTHVDILFQIGAQNSTNRPPVCSISPGTPLGGGVTQVNATVGSPVQFNVTGTDSDAGQTLTISQTQLPAGATVSPSVPASGASPFSVMVSYTPSAAGTELATFNVSDGNGGLATCTARIESTVTNNTCLDPNDDPTYAGGYVLNAAQSRAFVVVNAPRGAETVRFYNTSNLLVGNPETDAESGTAVTPDARTGDTFTFSSDPTMLYFPIMTNGGGTKVSFYLEVIDECGSVDVDPSFEVMGADLPENGGFALAPVAPNPTAGLSTIPFSLEAASQVHLSVYDVLGREVARLVDGSLPQGAHEARFDASSLPSGLYVIRLEADGKALQRTLTVAH